MNTETHRPGWSPLDGIHVLDFSAQLPGPMAASVLADLGATVIKVEPPGGEFGRQLPGDAFDRMNRNKRSIVVDLKTPAAKKIVDRLAAWADVVVESFRPGVADRLGIGAAALRASKPATIYCSLSGFGQTGPWRDLPGHDISYLAVSGTLGLQGEWNQRPRRSSLPIGDIAGSSFAVSAILAALVERNKTGNGCHIDMSLFESALYCTGIRTAFNGEHGPGAHLFPTQGLFETADGHLLAAALVEQHFWQKFVAAFGDWAPELRSPQFETQAGRLSAGDVLNEHLQRLFKSRTASEWEAALCGADIPIERCLTPVEAGQTEQVISRGALVEIDGRKYCPFPAVVDGRRSSRGASTSAPKAGGDSLSVLREFGFSEAEVLNLVQQRIVASPDGL